MNYQKFRVLTNGRATYEEFEAVMRLCVEQGKPEGHAEYLWRVTFGLAEQLKAGSVPLERKQMEIINMSKDEKERIFNAAYEAKQRLFFDKHTGRAYLILVGTEMPHGLAYLHLAMYHKTDETTGQIYCMAFGNLNVKKPHPLWLSQFDPIVSLL